jgi:hypothetical protein
MKMYQSLFGAAILGSLLVASAQASASAPFEAPVVTRPVSPTDINPRYKDKTINLIITVDANGRARDIKLLQVNDENLRKSLSAAVSQWQFAPGRRNGAAVAMRVVLPVQLVESSSS